MSTVNPFTSRIRGFRVIDITFMAVLLSVALAGYAFKTLAGAQTKDTAGVEAQIDQEDKRIRLLRAEISHLEDPGRIERLATENLGLQAVDPSHDLTLTELQRLPHTFPSPPATDSGPRSASDEGARPATGLAAVAADKIGGAVASPHPAASPPPSPATGEGKDKRGGKVT